MVERGDDLEPLQEHHVRRAEAFLLLAGDDVLLAASFQVGWCEGEGYFRSNEERAGFTAGVERAFGAVRDRRIIPVRDGISDVVCAGCHKEDRSDCGVSIEN